MYEPIVKTHKKISVKLWKAGKNFLSCRKMKEIEGTAV